MICCFNSETLFASPFLWFYLTFLSYRATHKTLLYRIPSLQYVDIQQDEATHITGPGFPSNTNRPNSSVSDSYSMKTPLWSTASKEWRNNEEIPAKRLSITTRNLLSYCFQCARGMKYLASKKVSVKFETTIIDNWVLTFLVLVWNIFMYSYFILLLKYILYILTV